MPARQWASRMWGGWPSLCSTSTGFVGCGRKGLNRVATCCFSRELRFAAGWDSPCVPGWFEDLSLAKDCTLVLSLAGCLDCYLVGAEEGIHCVLLPGCCGYVCHELCLLWAVFGWRNGNRFT